MKMKPLHKVPSPSTGFVDDAFFHITSILYSYERESDGKVVRSGIRFRMPAASIRTTERCCRFSLIEESYDTLVEIEDSSWAQEIFAAIPERHRKWKTNHYMIYLEGGCFEVIADSWDILPEIEGKWSDLFPDFGQFVKSE